MPSQTLKQARMFAMCAHDAKAAKRLGIKQSVCKDFNRADAKTGILKKHETEEGIVARMTALLAEVADK